jgi:DNA polymerase-1
MSKLLVIDLSNFIYRAFYATTPLTAPDGSPVNAVYGVMGMVHNMLGKYKPTHVLVARDSASVDSVRKILYPEYKANRASMPDTLGPQFALVNEMINALGIVQVRVSAYEADDVIGSVAIQWASLFDEILIATGDKDMLQYVRNNVTIVDTMKNIIYDREKVKAKMNVYPEHIVDYLALIGDTSDNIPGVEGIGPKGAVALIEEYGTVEKMLENIDSMANKRCREALIKNKDSAILSKQLVEINTELELNKTPDECSYTLHSTPELHAFFTRLGFKSWIGRF